MSICRKCESFKTCNTINIECKYELELILNNQLANVKGEYDNFTGRLKYGESSGIVENATFILRNDIVLWVNGIWEIGCWHGGIFKSGKMKYCNWNSGIFEKDGIWYNGNWKKGRLKGLWHDGQWGKGIFSGKWLMGEVFNRYNRGWETTRESPEVTKFDLVEEMIKEVECNLSLEPTTERINALAYIKQVSPIIVTDVTQIVFYNQLENILKTFKRNEYVEPNEFVLRALEKYLSVI